MYIFFPRHTNNSTDSLAMGISTLAVLAEMHVQCLEHDYSYTVNFWLSDIHVFRIIVQLAKKSKKICPIYEATSRTKL
jgi:hypothetical protein